MRVDIDVGLSIIALVNFVVVKGCPEGFGCGRLNLSTGIVKGNVWAQGEEYLTIPYARADRFEPPVLRARLPTNPFDATNILGFGQDACMQPPYDPSKGSYGVEECLILNLYLPRGGTSSGEKRPILLWIFGGDNSASEIIPYNATKLAGMHDAVVAVVSYRLGGLGFMAFEEDLGTDHGTGNWGLLDILAAASWLKREASGLGADPNTIIVFGESSGATDSQILSMIPAAKGLISGSIAESGGLYAQNLTTAINNTKMVARALGCLGGKETIKTCMKSKSGAALVNSTADQYADWGPTVDSVVLPMQPLDMLHQEGLNPGVSVLWGGNTNDSATPFMLYEFVSAKEYIQQLNQTVHGAQHPGGLLQPKKILAGHHRHRLRALQHQTHHVESAVAEDLLQRALQLYPPVYPGAHPDPFGNNAARVGWFESDQFLCNVRREVLAASKAVSNGGQAYMYRFDWLFQSNASCVADSNYHRPISGSNHCDEMTFVFGQPIFDNQDAPGYAYTNCSNPDSVYYDPKRCTGCQFDALEAAFSKHIGEFWTQFARSGSPGPDWSAFTASAPRNIVLHPGAIAMETDVGRPKACELWDAVAELHRATHAS